MEVDQDLERAPGNYEPAGPKPIKKLSKDVINQIAAAEIIHRPANAIKELIENSLDAGSTSIKITLKDGGLKLIQISDNGHGINKVDLPLLCTRYATSKLREFDDLQSLATYGFRGEALASISYVSHVDVVTKTKADGCGWRAHYKDGELIPSKPGTSPDPKPAAANDGTIISAEDLFYNMPLRKRAFKSPSDEYNRVLDVITKYAIHNPHSAWVCKKAGTSLPDISTQPSSSTKANIAMLYGAPLANELLEIPMTTLKPEDKLGAKLCGWVSNANSNWARKGGWILFINHRLVDSGKIKKAVDSLYTAYLPKGSSPWTYLSLEIDPTKVDVNVSPTKSEVHFLNEDEMIEAIVEAVQAALSGANTSRSFTVQTLLPGAPPVSTTRSQPVASSSRQPSSSSVSAIRKPAPNYKVRMDPSNRTLDSMISISNPSQIGEYGYSTQNNSDSQKYPASADRPSKRRGLAAGDDKAGDARRPVILDGDDEEDQDDREGIHLPDQAEGQGGSLDSIGVAGGSRWRHGDKEIPESECEFTSIQELRKECRHGASLDLAEILAKHAFVGLVDHQLCLSLLQHSTRLFLVNHAALADEHFYQLGVRQFGCFDRLKLEPPPPLRDLMELAAGDEPGITENGLEVDHVVKSIETLLLEKRDMLDEYFSLGISEKGLVESLPMVLRGYTPNLDRLPHFLLCLGTRVDWDDEKECFESFLRELAYFYSPRPFSDLPTDTDADTDNTDDDSGNHGHPEGNSAEETQHQLWQLEHVLFPSMRRYTAWPREMMNNGDVRQVANLPDLFRIFERC